MKFLLQVAALSLACFCTVILGHQLLLPGMHASPVWPAAGVALGAMLLMGRQAWPGIACGTGLAAFYENGSIGLSLGFAGAATLSALTGTMLLRRFGVGLRLEQVRDVLGFVLAGALIPSLVSASASVLTLEVVGAPTPVAQSWSWWWLGDTLGALLLGPLVLAWGGLPSYPKHFNRTELTLFLLVISGLVASLFIVRIPSLAYLFFLPSIWAALRFGIRGTTATTAVIAVALLVATTIDRGTLFSGIGNILILLSFLGVLTLTTLVLAAATAERDFADWKQRQDSEVRRAVVAGSPLAMVTLDIEGQVTGWNAAAERIFGYAADEVLGKPAPLSLSEDIGGSGFHQVALSGLAFSGVLVRRERKDGALVDLSLSTAPLRDENGQISGVVEIFADLTDRQRADEIIRQREARLKLILEQALDAVITLDVEGRVTGWNPQAESIFGWTAGEAMGRKLADTIVPERLRGMLEGGIDEFLIRGDSAVMNRRTEMAGQHRNGFEFPIELTIGSVRQGTTIIFSVFIRDITEQKRSDDALRASEDRYRAFVTQSTEAIWCCEFETPMPTGLPLEDQVDHIYQHAYLRDCNDEMARMYGFTSAHDLIGLRLDQLLLRSDPRNIEFLTAFLRSGYRLTDAESHEIDKDGRSKFFLNNFIGIQENGLLVRAWGTQRDVTEQKQAECRTIAFAALAHQLSGANEPIEAARIIVDIAQDLCGWEASSLDLYSAELDRVDAVLTVDLVDGVSRDIPPAYTGRAPSATGRKVIEEGPQLILRTEGEIGASGLEPFGDVGRRSASLMFVPVRHKDAVIGILSIQSYKVNAYTAGDLTLLQSMADQCGAALERIRAEQELRRTEAQLRQAQKMEAVGRLAGGIAHDFNNLLTTILGTSDLLLEELPQEKQWREDVEEIRRAGDRAAGLTRQLLAFSRKQVIEAETLSVNETVSGVSTMLRRLIGEDVELVTRLDPQIGTVRADSGQLEQVLMNLAVNARDAMPKGGTLIIETANVSVDNGGQSLAGISPGDYVMLVVSDNGIGMDAETRSHIFEPFFTTKEQGKGTGLGLATVYGIVRQSGGHVQVYSEPGAGATFRVYLPRIIDKRRARPATAAEPRGGSETILVAEDEPAVRNLARRILVSNGYAVITASGAEEALHVSRHHDGKIHLLLTDVVMPGMSGPQLAAALTTERNDARVLYMSGYTDTTIHHHGVLEPGIFYLQKPFSPSGLAEKVREVLDA